MALNLDAFSAALDDFLPPSGVPTSSRRRTAAALPPPPPTAPPSSGGWSSRTAVTSISPSAQRPHFTHQQQHQQQRNHSAASSSFSPPPQLVAHHTTTATGARPPATHQHHQNQYSFARSNSADRRAAAGSGRPSPSPPATASTRSIVDSAADALAALLGAEGSAAASAAVPPSSSSRRRAASSSSRGQGQQQQLSVGTSRDINFGGSMSPHNNTNTNTNNRAPSSSMRRSQSQPQQQANRRGNSNSTMTTTAKSSSHRHVDVSTFSDASNAVDIAKAQQRLFHAALERESANTNAAAAHAPRTVTVYGSSIISTFHGATGSGGQKVATMMPAGKNSTVVAVGSSVTPSGVWSTNPTRDAERDGASMVVGLHMAAVKVRQETVATDVHRKGGGGGGIDHNDDDDDGGIVMVRREVLRDVLVHIVTDQPPSTAGASVVIASSHHPTTGFVTVAKQKPFITAESSSAADGSAGGLHEAVVLVKGNLIAPFLKIIITPRRDLPSTIRVVYVNVFTAATESTRDMSMEPPQQQQANASPQRSTPHLTGQQLFSTPMPQQQEQNQQQQVYNSNNAVYSHQKPISGSSSAMTPMQPGEFKKNSADDDDDDEDAASPLPTNPSLLFAAEGAVPPPRPLPAAPKLPPPPPQSTSNNPPLSSIYASMAAAAREKLASNSNGTVTPPATTPNNRHTRGGGGAGPYPHHGDYEDPLDVEVSPNTPRVGGNGGGSRPAVTPNQQHYPPHNNGSNPTTPRGGAMGGRGNSSVINVSATSSTHQGGGVGGGSHNNSTTQQSSAFWLSGTPSPKPKVATSADTVVPPPQHHYPCSSSSTRLAEILFSNVKADTKAIAEAVQSASAEEVTELLAEMRARSEGEVPRRSTTIAAAAAAPPPISNYDGTVVNRSPSKALLTSPQRIRSAEEAVASANAAVERSRQRRREASQGLLFDEEVLRMGDDDTADDGEEEASTEEETEQSPASGGGGSGSTAAEAEGASNNTPLVRQNSVLERRRAQSLERGGTAVHTAAAAASREQSAQPPDTRAASTVPLPLPLGPPTTSTAGDKFASAFGRSSESSTTTRPTLSVHTATSVSSSKSRRRTNSSKSKLRQQLLEEAMVALLRERDEWDERSPRAKERGERRLTGSEGDVEGFSAHHKPSGDGVEQRTSLEMALLKQMQTLQQRFEALSLKVENGVSTPSPAAAEHAKADEAKQPHVGHAGTVDEDDTHSGESLFGQGNARMRALAAAEARHRAAWDDAPTVRTVSDLFTEGCVHTHKARERRWHGGSHQHRRTHSADGSGGRGGHVSGGGGNIPLLQGFGGSGTAQRQRSSSGSAAEASEGHAKRGALAAAAAGGERTQKVAAVPICLQPTPSPPHHQQAVESGDDSPLLALPTPFRAEDVAGYMAMPYDHFVIAFDEYDVLERWAALHDSRVGGGGPHSRGAHPHRGRVDGPHNAYNTLFVAFNAFVSAVEGYYTVDEEGYTGGGFAGRRPPLAPQSPQHHHQTHWEVMARCRFGFTVRAKVVGRGGLGGVKTFTLTSYAGQRLVDVVDLYNDDVLSALLVAGRTSGASSATASYPTSVHVLSVAAWLDFPARDFEPLFESIVGINTNEAMRSAAIVVPPLTYFAALRPGEVSEALGVGGTEEEEEGDVGPHHMPTHPLLAFAVAETIAPPPLPQSRKTTRGQRLQQHEESSPAAPLCAASIPLTVWSGHCLSGTVEEGVMSVTFAHHTPQQWRCRCGGVMSDAAAAAVPQRSRRGDDYAGGEAPRRRALSAEGEDGGDTDDEDAVGPAIATASPSSRPSIVVRSGHILDLLVAVDEFASEESGGSGGYGSSETDGEGSSTSSGDSSDLFGGFVHFGGDGRRQRGSGSSAHWLDTIGAALTPSQFSRVERIVGREFMARSRSMGRLAVLPPPDASSSTTSLSGTVLRAMVGALEHGWRSVAVWLEDDTCTAHALAELVGTMGKWQFGSPQHVVLFTSNGAAVSQLMRSRAVKRLGFAVQL